MEMVSERLLKHFAERERGGGNKDIYLCFINSETDGSVISSTLILIAAFWDASCFVSRAPMYAHISTPQHTLDENSWLG